MGCSITLIRSLPVFLASLTLACGASSQDSLLSYFGLERSTVNDERRAIGLGEWLSNQSEFKDLFENDPLELKIQEARISKGGKGLMISYDQSYKMRLYFVNPGGQNF